MPRIANLGIKVDDERMSVFVWAWFLGVHLSRELRYRKGRFTWKLALGFHDNKAWLDLFARPDEWRKADPWWRTSHSFDFERLIKGKDGYKLLQGRWRRVRLHLPEGDYGVEARRVVQIWTWSRWPWSRVRRCWDFQGTERVEGSDIWGIASGGTLVEACADVARRVSEKRGMHAPKHVPSLEAMRDAVDTADAG